MRRRVATALAAAALTVTGCTSGGAGPATAGRPSTGAPSGASTGASTSPASSDTGRPRFTSYVALGDSYTAAPLVPTTDIANGCFRSDHNYPSLLAKRLRVRHFTDVSCSAATTAALTSRQHTYQQASVPPQLRAVHRDTDLVTVGIGGNDFDLFGSLAFACAGTGGASRPEGTGCRAAVTGAHVATTTRAIGDRVAAVLRDIRRKAPHATVVLVGYLRLLPDKGSCPALGLSTSRAAVGRRASRELAAAMASAARRAGVRYLDGYRFSAGHDVCASHPWVNGRVTRQDRAVAYHPLLAGEQATARRLARMLR